MGVEDVKALFERNRKPPVKRRKNAKIRGITMKYIEYCRKSREEKDKQILSISAQIAELKEYAKKEHLEISEFVEEEKTAKTPGRGKFTEVLKKI